MSPIDILFLTIGVIGHVTLWAAIVNRVHAFGIQRKWVDVLTVLSGLMMACVPLVFVVVLLFPISSPSLRQFVFVTLWTYFAGCAIVCVGAVLQRWQWSRHPERRGALQANHTSIIRLADTNQPLAARGIPLLLSRLPGN